jgi:hypothetical protein
MSGLRAGIVITRTARSYPVSADTLDEPMMRCSAFSRAALTKQLMGEPRPRTSSEPQHGDRKLCSRRRLSDRVRVAADGGPVRRSVRRLRTRAADLHRYVLSSCQDGFGRRPIGVGM